MAESNANQAPAQDMKAAYDAYADQRSRPVAYVPERGGFYPLARYDDVRSAVLDWRRFSSGRKGVVVPPKDKGWRVPAIEMDPPEHGPWRQLYMEPLTARKLRDIEPQIVRLANELIDHFAQAGECDLMADLAEVLPVLGMATLIDLPSPSVTRIRDAAGEYVRSPTNSTERQAAALKLGSIVLEDILERRAHPREDFLTRVATVEFEGQRLNEAEIMRFMIGFLVAGHESTTTAMGATLFYALSNAELKARMLADDRVIAAAIDEAVRLHTPFHGFGRTTTEDVEVGGVTIPADSTVMLGYAAANRDPAVFDRPDEFRLDRQANPHLGFGSGVHMCPGAHFARLEVRVAFKELLRRLPDIRLVAPDLDWDLVSDLAVPLPFKATFTPAA